MNKKTMSFLRVLPVSVGVIFASVVAAEPIPNLSAKQKQVMVDIFIRELKQDNAMNTVAKCVGTAPSKLERKLGTMYRQCLDKTGSTSNQLSQCIEQGISSVTGLSETELSKCMGMSDDAIAVEQQLTDIENQIDELMDIYPLSDAQQEALYDLQQQQHQLEAKLYDAGAGDMSDAQRKLIELQQAIGDNEPTAAQWAEMDKLYRQIDQENMQQNEQMINQLKKNHELMSSGK